MKAVVEYSNLHPERVEILSIGVDQVTMLGALASIEKYIAEGIPRVVVTADASGVVAAQSDAQWRDIMQSADLVTPDSAGILWASRKLGQPLLERVSGVDLVDEICDLSSQHGYRIFFFGAAPDVAEAAADRMRLKHPGVNIVGTRHGFFSQSEETKIVTEISLAQPDVLFVAMGIPRQEKFINDHLYEIAAKVSMGVGGSFDVLSGHVRRAPKIIQRLRMEWFWRLILNPKKWRKVMTLPKFVVLVLRASRRKQI